MECLLNGTRKLPTSCYWLTYSWVFWEKLSKGLSKSTTRNRISADRKKTLYLHNNNKKDDASAGVGRAHLCWTIRHIFSIITCGHIDFFRLLFFRYDIFWETLLHYSMNQIGVGWSIYMTRHPNINILS